MVGIRGFTVIRLRSSMIMSPPPPFNSVSNGMRGQRSNDKGKQHKSTPPTPRSVLSPHTDASHLSVGDEIPQPNTLPSTVADVHVRDDQSVDRRSAFACRHSYAERAVSESARLNTICSDRGPGLGTNHSTPEYFVTKSGLQP